jgi:hypothetical protein
MDYHDKTRLGYVDPEDPDEVGTCPECGAPLTGWYDGGEMHNYSLVVPACSECDYIDWENAEPAE